RPDRGLEHSEYLASIRDGVAEVVAGLVEAHPPAPLTGPLPRPTQLGDTVVLCAWDPEGELAITQALLFEGGVPFAQAHRLASQMSDEELDRLWAAAVGERRNRRHRPSR